MVLAMPASQQKMTQVDNCNKLHMTKVQGKESLVITHY